MCPSAMSRVVGEGGTEEMILMASASRGAKFVGVGCADAIMLVSFLLVD